MYEASTTPHHDFEYDIGCHEIIEWLLAPPIRYHSYDNPWSYHTNDIDIWRRASEKILWSDPLIALAMEAGE